MIPFVPMIPWHDDTKTAPKAVETWIKHYMMHPHQIMLAIGFALIALGVGSIITPWLGIILAGMTVVGLASL
jgi:hypothetical protein